MSATKVQKIRRVVSKFEDVVAEAPAGYRVDCGRAAYDVLRPLIGDSTQERFVALLLDVRNKVVAYAEITVGTLTASLVAPREVFAPAIYHRAASIIVAHNPPSGDPTPSAEDYEVTKRLKAAGDLLGIPLLDHVVVGQETYVSMREEKPSIFTGFDS